MNQYHFDLDASFSAIGQLTKDIILDTWDHPSIELDKLEYLNNIEDHTSIYFIVLSKEATHGVATQEEQDIPVTDGDTTQDKQDIHVTDDVTVADEKNKEDKLDNVKNAAPKSPKVPSSSTCKSKNNKKTFLFIFFVSRRFVIVI